MNTLSTTRWRTLNYSDLLREEWEEEYFLFNPASGNTHVLNQLAVDILDRLGAEPASGSELMEKLLADYQPDDQTKFSAHLEHHLLHLDELGLITQMPS